MNHTGSVLIVVFDGLQPSQITPALMPNLAKFASDGVRFQNHHPVYPTVTRANVSSLVTGCSPGRHGFVRQHIPCARLRPNPHHWRAGTNASVHGRCPTAGPAGSHPG